MKWHDYLRYERSEKTSMINVLSSGTVRSSITTDGVQRDTTEENVARLQTEIEEIEQILTEAGEPLET